MSGFDRPNLSLEVQGFRDDEQRREAVVMRAMGEAKPGLVYTATRKSAEQYAEALADLGIDAAAYHAGMRAADREDVHERFTAGRLDVVVATTAFGMGIDKADVRFVLHAEVADSLDSYYQEIGRAGRDGEPAVAALFYRQEDLGLRTFFASGSADDAGRCARWRRWCSTPARPCSRPSWRRRWTSPRPGWPGWSTCSSRPARWRCTPTGRSPSRRRRRRRRRPPTIAAEVAEGHRKVEQSRVEMMRGYAETTGCRRQFLLAYFGETLDEPCGNCDTCAAGHRGGAGRPGRQPVRPAVEGGARAVGQRRGHALRGRPDRRAVRGRGLPHAVAGGGRRPRPARARVTRLEVDVVVVGGGPSGLAAASWLGRYRRSVVVLDSQEYRSAKVERSHGYLGRDPQVPLELLAKGREEVLAYPTRGGAAAVGVQRRAPRGRAASRSTTTCSRTASCWPAG